MENCGWRMEDGSLALLGMTSEWRKEDGECRMEDVGCRMQDAEYSIIRLFEHSSIRAFPYSLYL